jgi:GntR family transcriptional regulator
MSRMTEGSESLEGMSSEALAEILQRDISHGRFSIGAKLPSEADLRARHGVGRHTVREAVRRLEHIGLVEKRQGAATRVIALSPRSSYVHSVRTLSEVIQFARETQLEIMDRAVVTLKGAEAEFANAAPGTQWLRLRGVRRGVEDAKIMGFSTTYAHGRFSAVLADLRFPEGPIYAHIELATGEIVHEATQAISAGAIPGDAARALGLNPGETAIKVTRRYFDMSGGVMLASINWHSPATFSYMITLRRDQFS